MEDSLVCETCKLDPSKCSCLHQWFGIVTSPPATHQPFRSDHSLSQSFPKHEEEPTSNFNYHNQRQQAQQQLQNQHQQPTNGKNELNWDDLIDRRSIPDIYTSTSSDLLSTNSSLLPAGISERRMQLSRIIPDLRNKMLETGCLKVWIFSCVIKCHFNSLLLFFVWIQDGLDSFFHDLMLSRWFVYIWYTTNKYTLCILLPTINIAIAMTITKTVAFTNIILAYSIYYCHY